MSKFIKALIRAILGFTFSCAFVYATWPSFGPIIVQPFSSRSSSIANLVESAFMVGVVIALAFFAWRMGASFVVRRSRPANYHNLSS
jgi:cell division protein FtsX